MNTRRFTSRQVRHLSAFMAALACAQLMLRPASGAEEGLPMRFVDADAASGTSAAVIVRPGAALAHTSLMLPVNARGEIVSERDAQAQADRVLSNLNWALAAADSGRENTVKITVYAAHHVALAAARDSVAQAFPGPVRPAVTWVVNRQPDPKILVTMDAVAVAPLRRSERVTFHRSDQLPAWHGAAHVAVMPPGEVYHVAGQVAPGETLGKAAADTVRELHRTIGHFGLRPEHVVRIKAFVHSMEESEAAVRAIAGLYGEGHAPSIVITEWRATLPRPTEIELIAVDPRPRGEPQATRYLAPPWMTAPEVYSRMATARSDSHHGWVFFSGIVPPPTLPPEQQVVWGFDFLKNLCARTGSDLEHLVKATYYVGDPAMQEALRVVRPRYYHPKRPPAASLVFARGAARPDAIYTLDMIAVSVAPEIER